MRKKLFFIILFLAILGGCFYLYLYSHYTVPILMYHSFDESLVGRYAAVSLRTFYRQMEFIKNRGYKVITLKEYISMLEKNKPIPHNLVIITMDDGYKDNLYAAEVLKEFGYPAIIFIIVNDIGKEGYLSEKDIRWILNNTKIEIGSHTITGAYLPEVKDINKLHQEIFTSKHILEKMFGRDVYAFAYSIGGFTPLVYKYVREAGYECALTTNRGFSRRLDRYALRRIKVTNRDVGIRLWAKLSGFYNIFKKVKSPY